MKRRNFENLFRKLRDSTSEHVRSDLAEDIKRQIPQNLATHKGLDNINIIIDLRINRFAAAAIIIITTIFLANLLSTRQPASDGIYQDSKILFKHILAGPNAGEDEVLTSLESFRDYLFSQGKEVIYYGKKTGQDSQGILMQWKTAPGQYQVILGDLQTKKVTSEELVMLLSEMLQNDGIDNKNNRD
ncbi:MAG: hypothetical protein ACYTBP_00435 [Planctomycetota bacterium]|jgi:hypothetical protein